MRDPDGGGNWCHTGKWRKGFWQETNSCRIAKISPESSGNRHRVDPFQCRPFFTQMGSHCNSDNLQSYSLQYSTASSVGRLGENLSRRIDRFFRCPPLVEKGV